MLLIDAYNVLHVTGVLPPDLAGIEVDGLAALIDSSRYARRRTLLVCDGTGGAAGASIKRAVRQASRDRVEAGPSGVDGGGEDIRVLYAGPGQEADALIESLLKRYAGKSTLVVSGDRRVLKAAAGARARSLTSEKFLHQLVLDHAAGRGRGRSGRPGGAGVGKPSGPVPSRQAREWARQMGIEPDDPLWTVPARGVETPRSRVDARTQDEPRVSGAERPGAGGQEPPAGGAPGRGADGGGGIDPLILEAMKEWPGRIELDDLDMARWLAEDAGPIEREKH